MTDYKNLKLIATSNPHIRGNETTRSIMLDVIIAMCPALIWAIIYFGVEALLLTAVSVIGCVVFEGLYRKLMHKPQSIDDLSAVVTGMLLAFVCPATTPLWMILIGDFFAIIVVKQLFGGIGQNFMNPALAGRAGCKHGGHRPLPAHGLPAGWRAEHVPAGGGCSILQALQRACYALSAPGSRLNLRYSVGFSYRFCSLSTIRLKINW